jgi:feruloyl esterase
MISIPPRADAAGCESLAGLSVPNMTITASETISTGAFRELTLLPPFCRVAATLKPSSDSDIKIEVWLPASNWNGKFQGVGNGGLAGSINYAAMGQALRRGYATSSTDTGHIGNTTRDLLGHPEKVIDFGYRAIHEMTVKAKVIVDAFYGNGPRYSYFDGCSTGGRQGFKEAQRFAADYDGIIAGAPAADGTHIAVGRMWIASATLKDPASLIPRNKYLMIHQAVVGACDAIDGLKDGLIDDPRRCMFDFKSLECKAGDGPSCLTPAQADAAKKILSPATNPRTGAEIFPGLEPGSEMGWALQAGGPRPEGNSLDRLTHLVFKNSDWDWQTFNFDTDVALAEKADNGVGDAVDPNLKEFASRGGKLLVYHGWSDQSIAPQATIQYYNSVLKAMGGATETSSWIRLFMVPGMGHCGGGEGPNAFNAMSALEEWVEKGKAPDRIIASHSTAGQVDRTRPLCPYPEVARYTGNGSIDDAANFVCR